MKTDFEDFFEKEFPEFNLLTLSDERYEPGVLLDNLEKDIITNPKSAVEDAFKDTSLGGQDWSTQEVDTTVFIGQETFTGKNAAAVKILSLVGLKFNSNKKFTLDLKLENTRAEVFNSLGRIQFNKALAELKRDNRDTWKQILREFIVFESHYAESFSVDFQFEAGTDIEAELEDLVNANGSFNIDKSGSTLIVKNNIGKTPFAVVGFFIKRRGLVEKD